MDEKFVNGLLQSLTRQRDNALNAVAQLEAQMGLQLAENQELKAKLAAADGEAGQAADNAAQPTEKQAAKG